MLKKIFISIIAILLVTTIIIGISVPTYAAAKTENIMAKSDNSVNDGYEPTQLANGDFETYPDKGETSPTGGSDWQTSETTKIINMGKNGFFEWIDHTLNATQDGYEYRFQQNYELISSNGNFVEMNANHAAVLYQNLNTNPGDIILWKLSHATRNKGDSPSVQEMEVWIGKNEESLKPEGKEPKITKNLSRYTYNKITNSDGNYGYLAGGIEDLSALRMEKSTDWRNDPKPWKIAKAIYAIPADQTSTRFAFTSITDPGNVGNFLDDIVFETLLGNLKIDTSGDDGVKISGYWAPVEENKNVDIEYKIKDVDGNDVVVKGIIDLSQVRKDKSTGFSALIPYEGLRDGNFELEINHQKFSSAIIGKRFSITNIEEKLNKNIVDEAEDETEEEKELKNPKTGDNIIVDLAIIGFSIIALITTGIKLNNK